MKSEWDDASEWTKWSTQNNRGETRMKPSWEDAPEWANYLAQDENGYWHWYQNQPYTNDEDNPEWFNDGGKYEVAYTPNKETWKESLEERP